MGHPRKIERLELTPAEGGFVIHGGGPDKVHYLNSTAAGVLQLCDGQTSEEEIARLLQEHFSLSAPPIEEVVRIVEQFGEAGLVDAERP